MRQHRVVVSGVPDQVVRECLREAVGLAPPHLHRVSALHEVLEVSPQPQYVVAPLSQVLALRPRARLAVDKLPCAWILLDDLAEHPPGSPRLDVPAARRPTPAPPVPPPVRLDRNSGELVAGDRRERLAPPLARLLAFLMDNAQRIWPAEDLAAACWPQSPPKPRAVAGHISVLRRKLGERDRRRGRLRTLRGQGYQWIPSPQPAADDQVPAGLARTASTPLPKEGDS